MGRIGRTVICPLVPQKLRGGIKSARGGGLPARIAPDWRLQALLLMGPGAIREPESPRDVLIFSDAESSGGRDALSLIA